MRQSCGTVEPKWNGRGKKAVHGENGFFSEGRVASRAGQGLPELPRGPRNASRPCASGSGWRVERLTAGKQTMPGSVGQPTALARPTTQRLRLCGGGVKKERREWGAGGEPPARWRHSLWESRSVAGRARSAGTSSLASYCFPALRIGQRRRVERLTAGKQTMPGSVGQPTALARPATDRLRRNGRGVESKR